MPRLESGFRLPQGFSGTRVRQEDANADTVASVRQVVGVYESHGVACFGELLAIDCIVWLKTVGSIKGLGILSYISEWSLLTTL